MSACLSLPITLRAAHCGPSRDEAGGPGEELAGPDLLAALADVPDPRKSRGVRHRLVTVLGAAVCAVFAGARSYAAIAEWAADLPVSARIRLGITRRAPSESTLRRVLQAVDVDELDRVVSAWLANRTATSPSPPSAHPPSARGSVRAIAVDGKTARGARDADGPAVHLLAALDHTHGVVFGQTEVDANSNEITAFAPLLERIDITGVVITADALHCQHRHAVYLHERDAHYVFVVKGNQPRLYAQLAGLPWRDIPVADQTTESGHGRLEYRTLQLAAIDHHNGGIAFPHAQLAAQITRRRRPTRTRRWQRETVYAVTDLGLDDLQPDRLAEIIRGQWSIENRLHWIRDVTFAEDLSQIRTGTGPATMAVLRNLAVSRHRLAGATNITAACRHTSRHPLRATALLT